MFKQGVQRWQGKVQESSKVSVPSVFPRVFAGLWNPAGFMSFTAGISEVFSHLLNAALGPENDQKCRVWARLCLWFSVFWQEQFGVTESSPPQRLPFGPLIHFPNLFLVSKASTNPT